MLVYRIELMIDRLMTTLMRIEQGMERSAIQRQDSWLSGRRAGLFRLKETNRDRALVNRGRVHRGQ